MKTSQKESNKITVFSELNPKHLALIQVLIMALLTSD